MKLSAAAQCYKALGDRTRLRIVNLLADRTMTGTEIASVLRAPRARVARHLRYLYRSGLVVAHHQKNQAYYALREDLDEAQQTLLKAALLLMPKISGMQNDLQKAAGGR